MSSKLTKSDDKKKNGSMYVITSRYNQHFIENQSGTSLLRNAITFLIMVTF